MQNEMLTAPTSKKMIWIGRVLSALPVLFMGVGAVVTLFTPAAMNEGLKHLGYPEHLAYGLLLVEIACVVLYAIPQTAVLGAILLTAYLGGATASHVRVEEPWFLPVVFGVIVWLGLYFRDAPLRALIPFRNK